MLKYKLLMNPFIPEHPTKWTLANSVAPDQMLQNEASEQGLHCLYLVQE